MEKNCLHIQFSRKQWRVVVIVLDKAINYLDLGEVIPELFNIILSRENLGLC